VLETSHRRTLQLYKKYQGWFFTPAAGIVAGHLAPEYSSFHPTIVGIAASSVVAAAHLLDLHEKGFDAFDRAGHWAKRITGCPRQVAADFTRSSLGSLDAAHSRQRAIYKKIRSLISEKTATAVEHSFAVDSKCAELAMIFRESPSLSQLLATLKDKSITVSCPQICPAIHLTLESVMRQMATVSATLNIESATPTGKAMFAGLTNADSAGPDFIFAAVDAFFHRLSSCSQRERTSVEYEFVFPVYHSGGFIVSGGGPVHSIKQIYCYSRSACESHFNLLKMEGITSKAEMVPVDGVSQNKEIIESLGKSEAVAIWEQIDCYRANAPKNVEAHRELSYSRDVGLFVRKDLRSDSSSELSRAFAAIFGRCWIANARSAAFNASVRTLLSSKTRQSFRLAYSA